MKTHEHPSARRAMVAAASAGSTAQTLAGVVRYLRRNRIVPTSILEWDYRRTPAYRKGLRSSWKEAEAARTANPEAKRATNDASFRKRYLARLRREERRLTAIPGNSVARIVAWAVGRHAAKVALAHIAACRSIACGRDVAPKPVARSSEFPHAVFRSLDLEPRKYGWVPPTSRVRWAVSGGLVNRVIADQAHESVRGKGGNWHTVTPADHRATVVALAVVTSPSTVEWQFVNRRGTTSLPAGYAYAYDTHGLKVFRTDSIRDDYHPTLADLVTGADLVAKLEKNRATRLEIAAQNAAFAAEAEGVYVCVADSLRAGNCLRGTTSFAAQHHLDPRRHYRAAELLEIANGDSGRVRLTITAACIRHRREMECGFALLKDHQLPTNE